MANTERIEKLFFHAKSLLKESGKRMIVCGKEQKIYEGIIRDSYSTSEARPPIARKSAFLLDFAEKFPVKPLKNELIVGSARFNCPSLNNGLKDIGFSGNMGHIIVDYGRFLKNGVAGMMRLAENMPYGSNREAFIGALEAFSIFIRRHADVCRASVEFKELSELCEKISMDPPETFHEALQLIWFIQIFLHAESCAVAFSFGRFDQFMFPYLERDIASGKLTEEEAKELIACFYIKCCEGDESQNLILGGIDESGKLAENELSFLCLEVMKELKAWQPSLSVRFSGSSSEEFMMKSLELCLTGTGMPSFFNDDAVIASLRNAGIPEDRARDYGIVGCYEPSPQGDACPLTVAGGINLPLTLLDFMEGESSFDDFDSFLRGYKDFFKDYCKIKRKEFQFKWDMMAREDVSPFESVCVKGCIESGLAAEEGGALFNMFGVNLLGIGTLADSLISVKDIVFDKKAVSLKKLLEQLKCDFSDENLRFACRNLPEKYGKDSDLANSMAGDISNFVADTILESPLEKARTCPGFFWFGQDINVKMSATPDGRRDGERVSYGVGPGEHCGEFNPTSILNSASCIAHDKAPCGTALMLSFGKNDINGEKLCSLLKVYFEKGGFHLHVNITDAESLRKAQKNPELHSDILVRVSGYSARFSALSQKWQDAIIARTEKGI